MSKLSKLIIALGLFSLIGLTNSGFAQDVDPELYKNMKWRDLGFSRGGRSTTSAGIAEDHLTYYMGTTGGGLWKTENAGNSWKNISDGHFETATIGAIDVADSDPNVVYVGTGEAPLRGMKLSHGDGVYKSTDAGETWTNVGLKDSRQIARMRIHPNNPDVVYVAVQGNPWGGNEERGVYKTSDGGVTWEKSLFINDLTGAVDISMDMSNPRILYAAMWDHKRDAWQVRSGGGSNSSAIYKTTDGGENWEKIGKGLPDEMGKIG
ncbi:MAG: glycosyl hydrolase, partial [Kordiimonadaceae bacterium]|nr:glycosyl hydrolase [Kordiimonadaceae bacterium]